MIIVVCRDDPGLLDLAKRQSKEQLAVFGRTYQVFSMVPAVGVDQDIFLLAHGTKSDGEDRNPVIGGEQDDFYLNAVQLWEDFASAIPTGYRGNVYVSACQSANQPRGGHSFIEVLAAQIRGKLTSWPGRVYGQRGDVAGPIPQPGDRSWVAA